MKNLANQSRDVKTYLIIIKHKRTQSHKFFLSSGFLSFLHIKMKTAVKANYILDISDSKAKKKKKN